VRKRRRSHHFKFFEIKHDLDPEQPSTLRAGVSDHDLLFTRPGEEGGPATSAAAVPAGAAGAAAAQPQGSQDGPWPGRPQARLPAPVAPARRSDAGTCIVLTFANCQKDLHVRASAAFGLPAADC